MCMQYHRVYTVGVGQLRHGVRRQTVRCVLPHNTSYSDGYLTYVCLHSRFLSLYTRTHTYTHIHTHTQVGERSA